MQPTGTMPTTVPKEAKLFFADEMIDSKDGSGSMIDFESHKINCVVLSTTVSELYSFTNMFWNLSVSSWFADGHQCRARGDTYAD